MGNLYTQLVKRPSSRIRILSELKYAWRARPVNMNQIRALQKKLNRTKQQPGLSWTKLTTK